MNLPWKKKGKGPAVTAKTTLGAIRQLYSQYQKQGNLWGYTLLSSMSLICFWIIYSVFQGVNWSYLSLPIAGIVISALQMRRIKNISRILRQAHEVQQQIDKMAAEKKAREEAEAAKNGKKASSSRNDASSAEEKEEG